MRTTDFIKILLIPTPVQAIVSFSLALLILFIAHINLFISLVANSLYVPQNDVGQVVSTYLIGLSHLPSAEKVSVGVFWAVVASVVYILAVGANNVLVEMRNEYVIDTEFANEAGHRKYWITSTFTRIVWAILLFGLVVITFTQLIPTWFFWFSLPFEGGVAAQWWQPLVAIWGLTVNIYAIWVLGSAMRVVEPD